MRVYMKKIILLTTLLLAGFLLWAEDYPPAGWYTDMNEAVAEAERTGKNLFLDFTGSDWCVWCHRLTDEVFSKKEFLDYADENLVMVFLDSPRSFSLSEEQLNHNQVLQGILGVQGYPTIWLLGPDLTPLMKTGYREGGAASYVEHLTEDRFDVTEEQQENFRISFKESLEEYL